jgi:hypothetical protein
MSQDSFKRPADPDSCEEQIRQPDKLMKIDHATGEKEVRNHTFVAPPVF